MSTASTYGFFLGMTLVVIGMLGEHVAWIVA
jgi:hypothetical protein